MHPFLQKTNGKKVDHIIRLVLNLKEEKDKNFSNVFFHLYDKSGCNTNTESFLKLFTNFQIQTHQYPKARRAVNKLYAEICPQIPKDGMFDFWVYLVWVYSQIRNLRRNNYDNIFAFMTECDLKKIKVIFVAHQPSGACESSGHAFHGSKCRTTEKAIAYLQDELKLLDAFIKSDSIQGNLAIDACNLDGWIDQGVLLINSKLIYTNKEDGIWDAFTNFLVRELSHKLPSSVFVLIGKVPSQKECFIHKKHLTVKVYHPTFGSKTDENLFWTNNLPYLNANFYLYQIHKDITGLIDWESVQSLDTDQNERRLTKFKTFFDQLFCVSNKAPTNIDFSGEFLIPKTQDVLHLVRSSHGYFVIRRVAIYDNPKRFWFYVISLYKNNDEDIEIFKLKNNEGRTLIDEAVCRFANDIESFKKAISMESEIAFEDPERRNVFMEIVKEGLKQVEVVVS